MFYTLQKKAWCYNKHRTNYVTDRLMKIRNIIFKNVLTGNLILGILIQHSSKEEVQRSLKTEQE